MAVARMKAVIRSLFPGPLRRVARGLVTRVRSTITACRSSESIFTEIYRDNMWGGPDCEFWSGSGSGNEDVVNPYVALVERQSEELGFRGGTFVDLGCGDFRVGRLIAPLAGRYVGCDVVGALIAHNQRAFGTNAIHFAQLDIIHDPLPAGDVCFVRQVLQHLSNGQILRVIRKLPQYRFVYITEHQPTNRDTAVPNLDKLHGSDTRVTRGSGVYLDMPPFSIQPAELARVLETKGVGLEEGSDPGVIRTFLWRPSRSTR